MRRTTSYYIDSTTEGALAQRSAGTASKSTVLNRILDRYEAIVGRSMPEFSVNEWRLICDALRSTIFEPAGTIALLGYSIEQAVDQTEISEKWHVRADELAIRVHALSFSEKLAVADVVERFWTSVERGEAPKVPGEE